MEADFVAPRRRRSAPIAVLEVMLLSRCGMVPPSLAPDDVAGHTEAMFRAVARRERSTEILPDLPLPAIPLKMTKMVVELERREA